MSNDRYSVRVPMRAWRPGRGDMRTHVHTIFSLAVAFVCLAASLLVVTNLSAVRERWSHAGRATVYLRDNASEQEVIELVAALEKTHGIRRVRHITSAQARREVVVDEADSALASLPANAFPASLELGFTDEIDDQDLQAIALKLQALPTVETVETYRRWTERLSSLLSGGVTASAALAIVVMCAVFSVISSTMRLLLSRRRIEVEVLRLVGATNSFVRQPFVIEGAMQGAAGAAAAIALLGGLFMLVRGRFDHELANLLGLTPSFLPWTVSVGFVLLGGVLGATTALVSLRRMGPV
jgi:cell division transport system permease protein